MSGRKIIVLMGLPASGKSSFARELIKTYPSFRRVNKDTVREMINFSEWTHKGEALVQNIRDAIIHEIITSGYDVVIDDTNLQQVHIDKFNDIAELYDAKIEFIYFDVPLDECIRRDNLRVGKVGEVAIRRLWDSRTVNTEDYI